MSLLLTLDSELRTPNFLCAVKGNMIKTLWDI